MLTEYIAIFLLIISILEYNIDNTFLPSFGSPERGVVTWPSPESRGNSTKKLRPNESKLVVGKQYRYGTLLYISKILFVQTMLSIDLKFHKLLESGTR